MDKIFSLKEACDKNISKIRNTRWPEGQYIELKFVKTTPFPRCKWHVNGQVFSLPLSGINENDKCFTFQEGINSYDEYFDTHAYKELNKRISKLKGRK